MHFIKRLFRGLSSQILKLCLLFVAISTATVAVFGTSASLQNNVKKSGLYDKAVDSLVEQTKNEQIKKSDQNSDQTNSKEDIPFDHPAMQDAIQKALPASFLESTANNVLDGVYGWLEGKTPQPEFTIELAEIKNQLATGVGEVAYQKALTLPVCTIAQLRTLNPNTLDIDNLPCIPPGTNLQAERDKYVQTVLSSDEFLPDTTITSDDLPKNDGKNFFENIGSAPTAYQWIIKLPVILAIFGFFAGAGVVFLHDNLRRGLWVVSRSVFVGGLVILIGVLISNYAINSDSVLKLSNGSELEKSGQALARLLVGDFNQVLLMFCIPYMVIGGGGMLVIRLTRPKTPEHETPKEVPAIKNKPEDKSENPLEAKVSPEPKIDNEKPGNKL